MKKVLLYILLLSIVCLSCEGNLQDDVSPQLVVEGWIDNDGYPIVMVTQSVSVSQEPQSYDSLQQYLVKWARVAIADGDTTVVLTGKYDNRYNTSYIYTTSHLLGQVGKTYTLTVDYKDWHAEAETTIPVPVAIDSFVVKRSETDATRAVVTAYFTDMVDTHDYYQIFATTNHLKSVYYSTFAGSIDDENHTNPLSIQVYEPYSNNTGSGYTISFSQYAKVRIKLAHIDEQSYLFWKDFEKVLSLSRNQFFNATQSIHNNVRGALGYWCGYGATEYLVDISSELRKNKR
jgi:hypothetical protein